MGIQLLFLVFVNERQSQLVQEMVFSCSSQKLRILKRGAGLPACYCKSCHDGLYPVDSALMDTALVDPALVDHVTMILFLLVLPS